MQQSSAAPAASDGLVQPAEGECSQVCPTQSDLTLLTCMDVLVCVANLGVSGSLHFLCPDN